MVNLDSEECYKAKVNKWTEKLSKISIDDKLFDLKLESGYRIEQIDERMIIVNTKDYMDLNDKWHENWVEGKYLKYIYNNEIKNERNISSSTK